jgi:hypothetical protein
MLEQTKRLDLIYQDAATKVPKAAGVGSSHEVPLPPTLCLSASRTQMSFRYPLLVSVGLIAILDAVILHQFIGSMQRFRDRIDWIHKNAYPSKEQKPLRLDEADSLLNTSVY